METMQSDSGSWIVRLASGSPAERAIEPIVVRNVEELEQVLSGIFAAISLLGPGDHMQLNIDAGSTAQEDEHR